MLKLILKRYLLPLIIVVSCYSLLYLFSKNATKIYFNDSLFMIIIYSYALRFLDDFIDYNKDLEVGKVFFNKWLSLSLFSFLMVAFLALVFLSKSYFYLFLILMLGLLFIKNKYLSFLKLLIAPLICILLAFYELRFNWFLILVLVILVIADGYLIILTNKKGVKEVKTSI